MTGRRLECLDGLRGLLAFYVLVSHMAAFTVLPGWVTRPFTHGEAAVDLFFILSGMVIVRSLDSFDYERRGFLLARAARTLPAFLLVFVIAVAVQPLPTPLPWMPWVAPDDPGRVVWSTGWPTQWAAEIGAHLTMTHGLFPHAALGAAWISFLGSAWSLSTEWQFYVLIALLAPALRRVGDVGRALARLSPLFLAMSALALAWAWKGPQPWQFSKAFLPNKAQYFALGIASAGWTLDASPRARRCFILTLGATLALNVAQGGPGKFAVPLVWTASLMAQRASAGGRGQGVLAWIASVLRARPLLKLGAASYCIYLANEPVQKVLGLIIARSVHGDGVLFTLLWVPTAILLPLGLAWLLHLHVEQPALRAGRRLAARPTLAVV